MYYIIIHLIDAVPGQAEEARLDEVHVGFRMRTQFQNRSPISTNSCDWHV